MNEMKRYLPPLMKTVFWNSLLDSIDETIAEIKADRMDNIRDIYSLSDSSEDELISIASVIFRLDEFMLRNMLDFLTEIELYQTAGYDTARARALERFRQEIMKIPFSMDKRGTLQFYTSILEFCDFNYHGIISLIRTQEETRIAPLMTNLTLAPGNSLTTDFIIPETSEDFSGVEEVLYNTLDRIVTETGEYTKLDERVDTSFPTLDAISDTEYITYRKAVLIGLLINNETAQYFSTGAMVGYDESNPSYYYTGAPTFPEDLGRYYLSFINLNKRATDILIFGPMLALNIVDKETLPDSPVSDHRMSVLRNADTIEGYSSYFIMRYYENDEMFYEERSFNWNYIEGENETLVILGFCQGEYCRHYIDSTPDSDNADTLYSYTVKVPKSDWSNEIILRLYSLTDSHAEENLFLFYRDVYGEIVQRSSTLDMTLIATIDEESDPDNVVITFRDPEDARLPLGFTNAVYMSQRFHSKINKIELYAYNDSDEGIKVSTIEFHENTQIELCKGVTFSTYLSIHF